jgi:hypothetical protein
LNIHIRGPHAARKSAEWAATSVSGEKGAAASAPAAAPRHPVDQLNDDLEKTGFWRSLSKTQIVCFIVLFLAICGAVVGPVYYTQVVLPQDRAWAAANAPVPPTPAVYILPPLTPQFLDDFNTINATSWNYVTGDGTDKGWFFKGWGNDEKQVNTCMQMKEQG